MTGERSTATAGSVAELGSNWGIAAALIGGTLLAYSYAGYGVYALLSVIL